MIRLCSFILYALVFSVQLSLAIASEMIRSPHSALRYYSTVNSDLEASITIQVQGPERELMDDSYSRLFYLSDNL